MKVYILSLDVNNYQSFLAKDESTYDTNYLLFNCDKRKEVWKDPGLFIHEPKLKKGNFFGSVTGGFIIDQKAHDLLLDLFEMSGELLPITYKEEQFYIVNILGCYDLLDQKNTVWRYSRRNNKRLGIQNYAFLRDRFSETPLFKIPENSVSTIYCIEGLKGSENEFKSRVEQSGLKGLIFKEIWSDEE